MKKVYLAPRTEEIKMIGEQNVLLQVSSQIIQVGPSGGGSITPY